MNTNDKTYMPLMIFSTVLVCALAFVCGTLIRWLGIALINEKEENQVITLEEVLDHSECGYIVKDIETLSILEPSEYLDEEVITIAVCCDTDDTLCIFISLPEDEERIIVRNPQRIFL